MKTEYGKYMELKFKEFWRDWTLYGSSLTFAQYVALRSVR